MIEKIKLLFTIILVVILVVAVGYSIVKLTISAFKEPDLITSEEIVLHKVNSKLVQNYHTYYYLENCFNNLIEGCKQGKYEEIYKIYITDYKKQYDKKQIIDKLKHFAKADAGYILKNIYYVDEIYILEFETNGEVDHLLMTTDDSKQSSYQFAFIK